MIPNSKKYYYETMIQDKHIDSFDHVNNAAYLQLFEAARWDIITNNGYGIDKIKETGLGPTILKIEISFLKELHLHDAIVIETEMQAYQKKIGKIHQRILRNNAVACEAVYTMGLFDLNKRKLVSPTQQWLDAIFPGNK